MVEQGEISGSELERLRDAITIAFPTRQALARMLWFKLNEDLNRHVGEGALEDVVFDLLAWAETWGRIDALVKGALEAAPPERAEALRAFVDRRPALRRPRPAPAGLDFGGLLNDGTSALPEYKTPANLLNARHSVVPFYEPGRAALIDQLDDWINGRAPVSARLLHGEGGMGKTRLFIEMLSRRRAAGWAASGFVNARTAADRFAALSGSLVPALVVFDHAEGRHGLKDLLAIAAERRASRRAPLRIVLLARNDGDWWSQLRASEGSVGDLLADASAIELAPLARGSEERARVFGEAVQAFAWLLRKTTPRALPRLDHPLFDRTLYLHMAALALVEGLHVDAGTLIDEILSHEERFWRGLCDSSAGEIARRSFVDRLRAVVSTLTLFGGVRGRVEAKALNERALGERDPTALVAARRLYPGRRAEQRYLGGLEPDLLGEGMVRRRLLGEADGAGEWLNRVFEGATSAQTGFEVLGRISAYEGAARGWMAEVIEADVGGRAVAAFEAGKAVGSRTAFAALGPVLAEVLGRRGDADVARSIEATGIPDQTVSLGEVACWVMQAQLRALPAEGRWEVVVERARRLNNLGIRQSELGQREAALDSAEEATAIYRKLAEASPDAFLPYLAGSLNTLAAMQSELGQREAALNSTEEALDILWPFFLATPLPFIRNTAIVLENTLKRLEGLGREPGAALLERIVIFDAIRGG